MPLVSYALVTLAEAKQFLGIPTATTTNDELIEFLINAATDWIEKYTGRRFVSTVHTAEMLDGTGMSTLNLDNWPVTSFSLLERRDSTRNEDAWSSIGSEDFFLDENSGIVTGTYNFRPYTDRYRATYTAGYLFADLPYDLKMAALQLVAMEYRHQGARGIKSETLGSYSVTWDSFVDQKIGLRETLDRYARRNV